MKHLKHFATEVAVVSAAILAGTQLMVPLWEQEAAATAFTPAAPAFLAQLMAPSPRSTPIMPLRAVPGENAIVSTDEEELIPADGQVDTIVVPAAMPSVRSVPSGDSAARIADLERQLADANQVIQSLQQRVQDLTSQLGQSVSSISAMPVPAATQAAPVTPGEPVRMAAPEVSSAVSMPVAVPIAPPAVSTGPLCSLFGIAC